MVSSMHAPPEQDATVVPTPTLDAPGAYPTFVGQYGLATHTGCVRRENEDRGLIVPELGIVAVADGMGGHEDGAIASAAVVEALASIGVAVSAADLLARVEDRLIRANALVWDAYGSAGRLAGSTVAILIVFGEDFACVWAGDSRVYLVRDGSIAQLSRDHTEVRDLLDRGILTPEEARAWPRRNVITRAIGVADAPQVEFELGTIRPGDIFVICSDGLTGHVADEEILAHAHAARPQAACDALVALTLERGAADNVTVAIASFLVEAGTSAPGRLETVIQSGDELRLAVAGGSA